jgi:hypothetical protein
LLGIPGFRTLGEFYYYLDTREPLDLLAERRRLEIHLQMLEEIRAHREKDYAGAAARSRVDLRSGLGSRRLVQRRMLPLAGIEARSVRARVIDLFELPLS